jgi:hypothetical protein
MHDGAGREAQVEIRLVRQGGVAHLPPLQLTAGLSRRRDRRVAVVVRVAQCVLQRRRLAERVLEFAGRDVRRQILEIVVPEAVEIALVDRRIRVEGARRMPHAALRDLDPGQTVVRYVVLFLVEVAQRQAGCGAEIEGERRCEAPTLVLDHVAFRDFGVVIEHVQAQRHAVAEGLVDVGGCAAVIIEPQSERRACGVLEVRRLADLIHGACR